jgi:hypothetical protein
MKDGNEASEPQEEVEIEQVAATTTAEAPNEPSVEEEPVKPQVSAGVQKRIDQITRQKYDAERKIEELQEQLAAGPPPQAVSTEVAPSFDDFEDVDAYYVALGKFGARQEIAQDKKQATERQQQQTQRQTAQDYASKREQAIAKGIEAYPDFEEKALNNPDLVITQEMASVLVNSDMGSDVTYFLGNNVAESRRIAGLDPLSQAMEIGKIAHSLTVKTPKKDSAAPEPITPVGSRGATPTTLDPAKDYKKWAQARNEGKI